MLERLDRIGHIRIGERLGKGGMGEVWAGFDELLERPVAVKVLAEGERLGSQAKTRFLREARILSRLDHPGICRVWALHEDADADYLVLELIDGETLATAGPGLDFTARLTVATEIADALAAAHGAQVIHRDLKPANLMVTRQGHAKILDFGIARGAVHGPTHTASAPADGPAPMPVRALVGAPAPVAPPADPAATWLAGKPPDSASPADPSEPPSSRPSSRPDTDSTLTLRGNFIGTPQYMSPEQARAEAVTAASDIFSLGLILRELFTGVPAYPRDRPVHETVARAQLGATPPLPPIHPGLARLIGDMEAPAPEARPSAHQVAQRLATIGGEPQRRRRRWQLSVAIAGLALALAATLAAQRWLLTRPLLASGELARIAILPFTDHTGEPSAAWLTSGLSTLVARQLDGAERVEVADPVDVANLVRFRPAGDDQLSAAALGRLTAALGVRFVLATDVFRADDTYRLDAVLRGPRGDLARIDVRAGDLAAAGETLALRLAARLDPDGVVASLGQPLSADHLAATTYAIGLDRLNTVGAAAAEPWFRVALDRDSGFEWARLALADCLQRLGHVADSQSLLATVQAAAERSGDRRLAALALSDLGANATDSADYPAAHRHLEAALALERQLGDTDGILRSLNGLGRVARREGAMDAAEAAWEEALAAARLAGRRRVEATVLGNLAIVARFRQDQEKADRLFSASRQLAAELGSRDTEARALTNLGDLAREQQRYDDAKSLLEQAVAVLERTGNQRDRMFALGNLAIVARLQGDLDLAANYTEQVLATARALGDRQSEAHAQADLAELELARSHGDVAERHAAAAVALADTLGAREIAAYGNLVRARALASLGRRREALAALDLADAFSPTPESAALRRELGAKAPAS